MKGILAIIGLTAGAAVIGIASQSPGPTKVGEYKTPIEGRQADQRHNAFLALKKLKGRVIQPGQEFSFNKAVGTWSRDQGYRRAPVSFNGTLIDAWGGGVCQTSTTLYNAALLAGLEIVERHSHRFAPSYVAPGRDAAVAYPNIDLRFKNTLDYPLTIEGEMVAETLVLRLVGRGKAPIRPEIRTRILKKTEPMNLTLGTGSVGRVRSPGKPGWEVETYRETPQGKELISRDSYPVMQRVVERRDSVE